MTYLPWSLRFSVSSVLIRIILKLNAVQIFMSPKQESKASGSESFLTEEVSRVSCVIRLIQAIGEAAVLLFTSRSIFSSSKVLHETSDDLLEE